MEAKRHLVERTGNRNVPTRQVMLRLEEARPAPFAAAITEARAGVMAGLGAASMESYRRAYPFLLKLHSLRLEPTQLRLVWYLASYCSSGKV